MAGPAPQPGSTSMRISIPPFMAVMALSTSLSGLFACSREHPSAAATPRVSSGRASAASCDRVGLKLGDLAGILSAPITQARPVPGDVQSCAYLTEGFPSITISLRPGVGKSTLEAWLHGKMPFDARAVAGVGDTALWQAGLHELIARRDDFLCDVQVRAGTNDLAVGPDALAAAAGELCIKIFALPHS